MTLYFSFLSPDSWRVFNEKRPASAAMKIIKYDIIFKGRWNQKRLSTSWRSWPWWANIAFFPALPLSHSSAVLCTCSRFPCALWTKGFPWTKEFSCESHQIAGIFLLTLTSAWEGGSPKPCPWFGPQPQSLATARCWACLLSRNFLPSSKAGHQQDPRCPAQTAARLRVLLHLKELPIQFGIPRPVNAKS